MTLQDGGKRTNARAIQLQYGHAMAKSLQPEKGELICNNPNALKDGARRLHGRPVWKYLPNNRLRAIGCENRYYFTTERECWIAYSVQLEAQRRILKERQLKVTESIDTSLAQIISIQDREMGKQ